MCQVCEIENRGEGVKGYPLAMSARDLVFMTSFFTGIAATFPAEHALLPMVQKYAAALAQLQVIYIDNPQKTYRIRVLPEDANELANLFISGVAAMPPNKELTTSLIVVGRMLVDTMSLGVME